jgi:photosystem II stability/assembly factor-like uncharacterized protein
MKTGPVSRAAVAALALAGALFARAVVGQEKAPPVATSLTLFAGSPAGLWRSTDWGGSWKRVTASPVKDAGAVHGILALGSRVYVGAEAGLFISDDFGETWSASGLTVPAHVVLPSRYPQADPTVFVGTAGGLFKSEDAGKTFKPTPIAGTAVTRVEWPGPALVLATGTGVRVSMDAASTFTGPGQGLPEGPVGALALSSFFAVDPVIFASVGQEGVFRSGDGGRTWARAGLAGQAVTDLVWLGPILYAVSAQGLHRSTDIAQTWSRLGEGLPQGTVTRRILFPLAPGSGAEAFLATDRGIFRTGDGGERWLDAGLRGEPVTVVSTFPPPSEMSLTGKKR